MLVLAPDAPRTVPSHRQKKKEKNCLRSYTNFLIIERNVFCKLKLNKNRLFPWRSRLFLFQEKSKSCKSRTSII